VYTEEDLRSFIAVAKKAGYAGYGVMTMPSRIRSRDIPYKRDSFKYLDSYLGESQFIGEEAVWYENLPVWGMNYYGLMITETPPRFGEFLKSALREVCEEAPFRGPSHFRNGDYEYKCTWSGDISMFHGGETMLYKDMICYRLYFHGGTVHESDTII